MLFDRVVLEMLGMGILESLYMTFVSSFIAYAIGLPTGILLVITDSDGVLPKPMLNKNCWIDRKPVTIRSFYHLIDLGYTGHAIYRRHHHRSNRRHCATNDCFCTLYCTSCRKLLKRSGFRSY